LIIQISRTVFEDISGPPSENPAIDTKSLHFTDTSWMFKNTRVREQQQKNTSLREQQQKKNTRVREQQQKNTRVREQQQKKILITDNYRKLRY